MLQKKTKADEQIFVYVFSVVKYLETIFVYQASFSSLTYFNRLHTMSDEPVLLLP